MISFPSPYKRPTRVFFLCIAPRTFQCYSVHMKNKEIQDIYFNELTLEQRMILRESGNNEFIYNEVEKWLQENGYPYGEDEYEEICERVLERFNRSYLDFIPEVVKEVL